MFLVCDHLQQTFWKKATVFAHSWKTIPLTFDVVELRATEPKVDPDIIEFFLNI